MLSLTYSRKSVCMGDDADCGDYTLALPDGATIGELMDVLLHGGCGNDWPIPYTGANSLWVIRSNIGRLGAIRTDARGEWHIHCTPYPAKVPLASLGIMWVYGDRDGEEWEDPDGDVVYRDERYTLGRKNDRPYLRTEGNLLLLSCHPYEPCLYITDKDGWKTTVHSAFDPSDVLRDFSEGRTVTSITGREYSARDFCEMVEYAAGRRNITISDAEEVFRGREKEPRAVMKPTRSTAPVEAKSPLPAPEAAEAVPESPLPAARPFSVLYADFPDAAADIYIVRDGAPGRGLASHRRALAAACRALSAANEDGDAWRFSVENARGRPVSANAPFLPAAADGAVTLRKAVLDPPHGCLYDDAGFDALCAALFPHGRGRLEVFEWSTDWSDYFDEGHEWWGAMCYTVYDRASDRYAVLLASATD